MVGNCIRDVCGLVMEAASLSSPQRRCAVVPVQKSLSLPSYARAGGEGIDHRLIFAALEQKERVRRKSRIFATKEKSSRPNLFCLPIPSSGAKCRETSLSSDTSCSSLEYKKSSPVPKRKKEDKVSSPKQTPTGETITKRRSFFAQSEKSPKVQSPSFQHQKTSSSQLQKPVSFNNDTNPRTQERHRYETTNIVPNHTLESPPNTNSIHRDVLLNRSSPLSEFVPHLRTPNQSKTQRSPANTLRLNVGSSDSMERSSRSSSDSLNRKERMVALKARVEAAREKLGDSSSDDNEQNQSLLTRYNSDGVIHRDIKSRYTRLDRRLRRRSQDEISIKRMQRKNLSLSLNPADDSISLSLQKLSAIEDDSCHLDIKTDFCPSPNFPDLVKKNYFSDFPGRENAANSVQAKIRLLEDEERKRRSGSDFRDKLGLPFRHSPQNVGSPASTLNRRVVDKSTDLLNKVSEKLSQDLTTMRSSPIPRSSQAPTPPPRSPKSITFVNKAFIQHQNSILMNQENSLERKSGFRTNSPLASYSKIFEKTSLNSVSSSDAKSKADVVLSEESRSRESITNRRRTCGNFDFIDDNILNELCSIGNSNSSNSLANGSKFSPAMSAKKTETTEHISGYEIQQVPSEEDIRNRQWKTKWQENEEKREYMFNSLENKKKLNIPSWQKRSVPSSKTENCLCRWFPDSKISCACKHKVVENDKIRLNTECKTKHVEFKPSHSQNVTPYLLSNSITIKQPFSKRENSTVNSNFVPTREQEQPFTSLGSSEKLILNEGGEPESKCNQLNKVSATANLDTAMEELENIYKSLKISCDTLCDRNNVSISLSDNDVKFSKPKDNNRITAIQSDMRHLRRSSMCETKLSSPHGIHQTCTKSVASPTTLTPNNSMSTPNSDISHTEQFSIDELFRDLTQQIDMEQKLIKEPRENRQQVKIPAIPNRLEDPISNYTPQVSMHKKFYENLSRSNSTSYKSPNSATKENGFDDSIDILKRKHKAVRSLSENISSLMGNSAPQNTEYFENGENNRIGVKSPCSGKSSPKYQDRIVKEALVDNSGHCHLQTKLVDRIGKCVNGDEIRQIRVSMDSGIAPNNAADTRHYPSLSSAVCQPAKSDAPKLPVPGRSSPCYQSKENPDVLDETGLEKLLNNLLGEVSQPKSSLTLSKDSSSTTAPTTATSGTQQDVIINRFLPLIMDSYAGSKERNKDSNDQCHLKSIKSEENAQKTNLRQNINAPINHASFIPIYTKKNDMCHNFPKGQEDKCKRWTVDSPEPAKSFSMFHSPPLRQKGFSHQNEKSTKKPWNMHLRRQFVGFEDVASLSTTFGSCVTNKRAQSSNPDSEFSNPNIILNSENERNFSFAKEIGCESVSAINQNSQVTDNENDHVIPEKQYLKDKSSKRKSSLNRIDFVDFSVNRAGHYGMGKTGSQSRNSSSDEGNDSKSSHAKPESLNSKRRHFSLNRLSAQVGSGRFKEIPRQSGSSEHRNGERLIPHSVQHRGKLRQHKRVHSVASQLRKSSHSAGEIETVTDLSEVPGTSPKVYLSAQEYDPSEAPGGVGAFTVKPKNAPEKAFGESSYHVDPPTDFPDDASHSRIETNVHIYNGTTSDSPELTSHSQLQTSLPSKEAPFDIIIIKGEKPVLSSLELNGALDLKHIDSKSEDEAEIAMAASKIRNLDISDEIDMEKELYISADDSSDPMGSDTERRLSSILRKKLSGRRELHSILKPPPDDKYSRTPLSILKHRDSSEEKEVWQLSDLHSILKKSTSEDESCPSGPDIRPILKVSTDDESVGGSLRPRPILKKRTSFSEECSYASYPNGELKPILKKKSPLALDEQPRPILKSRRKSEDSRSSNPEFVASRPRAYSADMGVKPNVESRSDDKRNEGNGFCDEDS